MISLQGGKDSGGQSLQRKQKGIAKGSRVPAACLDSPAGPQEWEEAGRKLCSIAPDCGSASPGSYNWEWFQGQAAAEDTENRTEN